MHRSALLVLIFSVFGCGVTPPSSESSDFMPTSQSTSMSCLNLVAELRNEEKRLRVWKNRHQATHQRDSTRRVVVFPDSRLVLSEDNGENLLTKNKIATLEKEIAERCR